LWLVKHVVSRVDRFVVRASAGRLPPPSRLVVPSLLLTVVGAKTGREDTVPLVYVRDGSRFIVANARPAGERRNPWIANLRAAHRARIQVGRHVTEVKARELADNQIDRHWLDLTAVWPSFAEAYGAIGERTVFSLEPTTRGPEADR
jgi:deazaflavin-dependent oxidoreductase (nitroreductase family)